MTKYLLLIVVAYKINNAKITIDQFRSSKKNTSLRPSAVENVILEVLQTKLKNR